MAEPTVIDSLIVSLGLDPTNYSEGRKAAAADLLKFRENMQATAKDAEHQGKKAASFFGQVKTEALGLFATIVGARGLEQFVATTVTNLAQMGRAAKAMGMDVAQVSAFGKMIERNGGDAKAATAELQGLAQAMEQWRVTGNTPMLPWLNRVGASANDNPFEVYMKFAKWAEGRDAKLVTLEGQNLGFDEATINQAMKGSKAVGQGMAESYRLGVPQEADIQRVQQLQQAFQRLRQAVTGDAQALVKDAAPAMVTVLNLVSEGIEKFPQLTKAVLALGAAFLTISTIKTGSGLLAALLGRAGAGAAAGGATAAAAAEGGGLGAALGAGATTTATLAAPVVAFLAGIGAFGKAGEKDEAARLAAARASMERKNAKPSTDLDYAVRTLIGEARPGDVRGQMDVAHVIKNRMNATGKGAADIVLQPGQFEPWGDPATRRRLSAIDPSSPVYQRALQSWIAAMKEADPTNGATLFVSPGGQSAKGRAMPSWARPGDMTLAREGHQFYRGSFPGQHGALPSGGAGVAATGPTIVQNHTTIGQIVVTSNATDADGIARDIGGAMRRQGLAVQANTGLE